MTSHPKTVLDWVMLGVGSWVGFAALVIIVIFTVGWLEGRARRRAASRRPLAPVIELDLGRERRRQVERRHSGTGR